MQHEQSAGQTPKEKARIAYEANRAGQTVVQITNSHFTDTEHQERKRVATLQARAALLGLQLQQTEGGACVLVGEAGRRAELPSLQAAESLVYGCEHVASEIAAMVGRMRLVQVGVQL